VLVQPLNMLEDHCTSKSRKSRKKARSPALWEWGQVQQSAFDSVKRLLTESPVLGIADYPLPFIVHTDASGLGLGAVLLQKQDGKERVIAYASRGLVTKSVSVFSLLFNSCFFFCPTAYPPGLIWVLQSVTRKFYYLILTSVFFVCTRVVAKSVLQCLFCISVLSC